MATDQPRTTDDPQAALDALTVELENGGLRVRRAVSHGLPIIRVWNPEQQGLSVPVGVRTLRDGSPVYSVPQGLSFGSTATPKAVVVEIGRYLSQPRAEGEVAPWARM